MKILVDMNLSPVLGALLGDAAFDAVHWSSVGDAHAADEEIMAWADVQQRVVVTHDLDLGAVLALTHVQGPSVIRVRHEDIAPALVGPVLLEVLEKDGDELSAGALVVIDPRKRRVRMLPLGR